MPRREVITWNQKNLILRYLFACAPSCVPSELLHFFLNILYPFSFPAELSSVLFYRHWTSDIFYQAWHKARTADSSPSSSNNALYHFLWVVLRNCSGLFFLLFFFFPTSAIHRCKVSWIKTHCKNCSQYYWSELLVFISFLQTLLSNNLCKHQYIMTKLFIICLIRSRITYWYPFIFKC